MDQTGKNQSPVPEKNSPGVTGYDYWRQVRVVGITILVGIIAALIFGLALYQLNVTHRFEH